MTKREILIHDAAIAYVAALSCGEDAWAQPDEVIESPLASAVMRPRFPIRDAALESLIKIVRSNQ